MNEEAQLPTSEFFLIAICYLLLVTLAPKELVTRVLFYELVNETSLNLNQREVCDIL